MEPLPVTEATNERSRDLDRMSAREIVALMCDEDRAVLDAVAAASDTIARAIDEVSSRLERGGRLVYVGAGTSGRLGVLDAAECPPTFRSDPGQVVGVIAGGDAALRSAVEGAEDDVEAGAAALRELDFGSGDVCVGITASGSAPFVLGACDHARRVGGSTVALVCNRGTDLAARADIAIEVVVGPEVLSGSTRLKAGTATKLVLNMLSTGSMVRLGKCYRNVMVDLRASNQKLRARAVRIVRDATGLDESAAREQLARSDGEVKTAIVAARLGLPPEAARVRLADHGGRVRDVLEG